MFYKHFLRGRNYLGTLFSDLTFCLLSGIDTTQLHFPIRGYIEKRSKKISCQVPAHSNILYTHFTESNTNGGRNLGPLPYHSIEIQNYLINLKIANERKGKGKKRERPFFVILRFIAYFRTDRNTKGLYKCQIPP